MGGFEFNKIMMAVLIAGITASFAGFVSRTIFHPHELEENAYHIEGVGEPGAAVKEPVAEPMLDLIANADIAHGQTLSKVCSTCHSFEKGGPAGQGPNLWGIIGSDIAHMSDFDYSDAMAAKEGNWTYAKLNKFLWKPKKYIDGTKMNYIGMKKPQDRADIIAWLRTMADSPAPLPTDNEIAAERAELAPEPAEEEGLVEEAGELVEEVVDEIEEAIENIEPAEEIEIND